MSLRIDKEVLDRTVKCQYNFKCLSDECPGCKAEYPISEDHIFVKMPKGKTCNYAIPFGLSAYVCTCPTRSEIYRKYKK